MNLNFKEIVKENELVEQILDVAFSQLEEEDENHDEDTIMDKLLEDIDYLDFDSIEEILEDVQVDEKLSVADAIKSKKQKRKRGRTAAGKLAKKKLKRKLGKASYRPNKLRSRKAKKGARIRRNIPGRGV